MNDENGSNAYQREDFISEANQSVFTFLHKYFPNQDELLIFLNGDLQRVNDDYLELNSNSIQFVDPCSKEDIVSALFVDTGASSTTGYLSNMKLGSVSDNSWMDGLFTFDKEYVASEAIDNINEALLELAPEQADSLQSIQLACDGASMASGYASAENINYETFAGDYYNYLTKSNNFKLYSPDSSFKRADLGTLKLYLNGVEIDSFDLGSAFVEADRQGNQSSSNYGIKSRGAKDDVGSTGTDGAIRNSSIGMISIMNIGEFNSFKYWQKGKFRININPGTLRQGYNFIQVAHFYSQTVETTQHFKLFLDTASSSPSPEDIMLTEKTISSLKYLSGIRYYSIGDTFNLEYSLINSYANTYVEDPVSISMPGFQLEHISWNDQRNSGNSMPPKIDDVVVFNSEISLDEYNDYSTDAQMEFNTTTPFDSGVTKYSGSVNRYVNTFTNKSTDLIEWFVDENYRLPIASYDTIPTTRKNVWRSDLTLSNGNAMLLNQKLVYPSGTYNNILPVQTVNYSGFNGNQYYLRSFYKREPNSGAIINIQGITKNDLLTSKIIIDIKLPGQTGWLSLNSYYDVALFSGMNGDGCLVSMDDSNGNIETTFGTFSTVYSGYMIIMKITIKSGSPEPNYIEVLW